MRPHERLDVWKKAIEFVIAVYNATDHFPKEERFGLTSQLRRAAVSIPANIAEGAGRKWLREFAHFLSTSQGSASERYGTVDRQSTRLPGQFQVPGALRLSR